MDVKKLGKRAFAVPFAICVMLVCVLSVAVAPILRAAPSGIPFAIVSLDEGAATPAGEVNLGDTMVEGLLLQATSSEDASGGAASGSAMADAIAFTQLESEGEARTALEENEYYGAIIIPEDFTAAKMAAASGSGDAPSIAVVLNQGKNPMVANSMQSALPEVLTQLGVAVEVETVHAADVGGGMMSAMMAVQMMVMPLMMMIMIPSILASLLMWPRKNDANRATRAKKAVAHVAYAAALSLVAAACAVCVDQLGGGMDLPLGTLLPFLWLAAFCLMVAVIGLCDLCLPLGALVAVCVFALGMGTAMLAPEMLPSFWADWVYPWAPQAAIGDGIRSIVYMGADAFEVGLPQLLTSGAIGLVALVTAVLVPVSKKQR